MKGNKGLRMCVVCRGRFEKKDLARIVKASGQAVYDRDGRMQTRGIYICRECARKEKAYLAVNGILRCSNGSDVISEMGKEE